jgi:hypothetical protein
MRHLRHVAVLVGGLAGSSIGAAVTAAGCSSNGSTSSEQDSGPDVTTDAHPDVQQSDVQADVPTQDVQTVDVVEAGTSDADAGDPIGAFLVAQATALCAKLEACCAKELPGATIDGGACIASVIPYGYSGTATGTGQAQSTGKLAFDSTKASACLSEINAIDCTGNIITTQQEQQIISNCSGAITGTKTAGASCFVPIECSPGMFCDTPSDGGAGQCAPLRGDGGSCGDFGDMPAVPDYALSNYACSYKGLGDTQFRCDNADPVTGLPYPGGPAVWVCRPDSPEGGPCNKSVDCTTGICDPGAPGYPYNPPDGAAQTTGNVYKCATSAPFVYLNNCRALTGQ